MDPNENCRDPADHHRVRGTQRAHVPEMRQLHPGAGEDLPVFKCMQGKLQVLDAASALFFRKEKALR